MHQPLSPRRLLLLFFAAVLAALSSHALARPAAEPQLVPPPTLSCGPCRERSDSDSESVKWCQRCFMAPVHCSLEFSVACNSTVDRSCIGDIMDCVHEPEE